MSEVQEVLKELEPSFEESVWKNLSRVDCSKMIEKKGRLSYLSWASAWGALMEWYPESTFRFDEPVEYADGTAEIWVYVTVRHHGKAVERFMWLPVLDHQNRPIRNPNAFQINTARMRCLTKCLAMFGLGHHVYKGEDVPSAEHDVAPVGEKKDNSVAAAVLDGIEVDAVKVDEYFNAMQACVYNEDYSGANELMEELNQDQDVAIAVWKRLNSKEKRWIKEAKTNEAVTAIKNA